MINQSKDIASDAPENNLLRATSSHFGNYKKIESGVEFKPKANNPEDESSNGSIT